MTASASASPRTVAPLAWGHGPRRLEVFLEPTCPFSGRAFGKFDALLQAAGEDRLTLVIRLQSQPWHAYSPFTTRAVLAAAATPGGKAAAKAVLAALYAHRAEFEPDEHSRGPLLDRSARALLQRLVELSSVDFMAAFEDPALTAAVKWQAKYARQNGIHVTPTFMVDGLVVPDMGSGDEIAAWLKKLGLEAR